MEAERGGGWVGGYPVPCSNNPDGVAATVGHLFSSACQRASVSSSARSAGGGERGAALKMLLSRPEFEEREEKKPEKKGKKRACVQ